jgi:LPXTG-site transpeptidase (sortase) family protein
MSFRRLFILGLILAAFGLAVYTYYPYLSELFVYRNYKNSEANIMRIYEAKSIYSADPEVFRRMMEERQTLVTMSEEFGLLIPKLRINEVIYPETSFQNSKEYQKILTKGVAHAKWSGYPNKKNTVFLFAHHDDAFWKTTHYNTRFLLLNQLKWDDKIHIFYKSEEYVYRVVKTEILDPLQVNFTDIQDEKELVKIQTDWPPGTTFKRLVVTAERID